MPLLKVCGITRLEDAIVSSKADLVGVVLEWSSPRAAPPSLVREIKQHISVPVVAVKVTGSLDEMFALAKDADYLQIHRVLTADELSSLDSFPHRKILYVPADRRFLPYLKAACDSADMVLVDSPDKSIPTDIEVAKSMVHECSRAGVAGGISLDNLHLYMDIKPYLIDISRGVEVSPGIKDHKKLIELFKRVKGI